jgi:hypothetical protein
MMTNGHTEFEQLANAHLDLLTPRVSAHRACHPFRRSVLELERPAIPPSQSNPDAFSSKTEWFSA